MMELNFLNKLEFAIFKHFNPEHQSVTGKTVVNTMIGGTILSLIVFFMQMVAKNDTAINVVAGIGLIALFGWAFMYSFDTLKAFPSWVGRILYGLYILFLTSIAFMIAMWLVVIALTGLVIYGVFKIFFSSGSSSKSKGGRSPFSSSSDSDSDSVSEIKVDCPHKTISGGCKLNNGWSCHIESGSNDCPYGLSER